MPKHIVPQPHWKTSDEAAEVERDGYVVFTDEYMQRPVLPLAADMVPKPKSAKQREMDARVDAKFRRENPGWERFKRDKGWA